MEERPTKRRGPLTLLLTSRRFRRCVMLLMGFPVAYVASFGPACWLMSHSASNANSLPGLYMPVGLAYVHGSPQIKRIIESYTRFGMKRDTAVAVPAIDDNVMIFRNRR